MGRFCISKVESFPDAEKEMNKDINKTWPGALAHTTVGKGQAWLAQRAQAEENEQWSAHADWGQAVEDLDSQPEGFG